LKDLSHSEQHRDIGAMRVLEKVVNAKFRLTAPVRGGLKE